ncbi:hypothetical protein COHA_009398 [Chlorella ohadii]|uniref:non-specific serine/threonine protein kinase n=1 Tax=Chlorella ohadii TaxID=2649997 RepID=A0AAD5DJL1_9CHLO|nr:hypothetical protein COHA_009398 [Chlorella ohadii]
MKFKSLFKPGHSERIQLPDTELELHKHFRLVRKLGRGSFATVYEAERLSDGQRYALKVTELNALSQLDKVAVVEEIRLLASLSHPTIISYFEAFCDRDKLCVVTEIVQGGDLGTFIRKMADNEDFLWERQIWNLFLQAALGVQYLHRNHVLHRDLKPQNIMMTDKKGQGLLKIADLGVSAELARVFTNVQIGTPHYMAPEMWNRKAYSYSADIWALGCILHELCTLRPTFLSDRERTEEDIKQRVLRGGYDPIHTRYSLDLRKLVDVMLQRDPAKRPTIDEIMRMPEVRSKLQYLPLELQRMADEQQRPDDPIKLEQALGQLPDDLHSINCLLPPARYATGSGVAELMCGMPKRRSFSLSDLEGAAERQRLGSAQPGQAAAAAAAGQRTAQLAAAESMERAASSSMAAGGRGDGSEDGTFADGERVHKSRSMGRLDAEEAERRLRRRSIMASPPPRRHAKMFKKLLPRKSARRWLGSQTELELERHFDIERKLGKGSYAVVFAARRHDDGQLYALKVADIHSLGPLEQADVVNEIRLLASLSHPNLTTFYESFCDHGKLCIVQASFPLLNGLCVFATAAAATAAAAAIATCAFAGCWCTNVPGKRLFGLVWATFLQIALGLQYLHHSHVLHRDLKPKNLLISEGGVVKLADLGISQVLDRVFADTMIGTPHYMAPEMWNRKPYSYSADIWALGCILHELCTLKPLFLAPTDDETRQKVLSAVVPRCRPATPRSCIETGKVIDQDLSPCRLFFACRCCLVVVPPLPPRYSPELRSLVAGILQQNPAKRPTIDDILQTPAAQQHLALLPEELRQRCISPALSSQRPLARLLQPIKVPQHATEWDQLNHLMPMPRYSSGGGVSSALRSKSKRGSWSTGDLQALAAEADAELASSGSGPVVASLGSPEPGASGGLGLAAPLPPPAAVAAAAMRKVQSHGGLAAAVEAQIERSSSSLTRRRTLGVGEMLPLAAEGRRRSGGGGVGSTAAGGTAGSAAGRRGASGQLGTVAEEAPSGSGSPGPASSAAGGPGEGSSKDRGPPVVARSKSLSVEDALQVLASGGSLPGVPGKPAAKVQQGGPAAAGPSAAGAPSPPRLPAAVPSAAAAPIGPGSSVAPAAAPAANRAAGLPAAAAAQPILPQPGAPLASPPVTADVRLGAGGSMPKQAPVEAAAVAGPANASQQGQASGSEEKRGGGKKHFWQRGKC